jgi:hypothetical protein
MATGRETENTLAKAKAFAPSLANDLKGKRRVRQYEVAGSNSWTPRLFLWRHPGLVSFYGPRAGAPPPAVHQISFTASWPERGPPI